MLMPRCHKMRTGCSWALVESAVQFLHNFVCLFGMGFVLEDKDNFIAWAKRRDSLGLKVEATELANGELKFSADFFVIFSILQGTCGLRSWFFGKSSTLVLIFFEL